MSKNDLLSAEHSPKQLNAKGVKRVNNMPLIICLGVFTVFVLLIALVTVKRANAQNHASSLTAPREESGQNSMSMAHDVVGKRIAGIVPSAQGVIKTTETISLPVAVADNLDAPPRPYVEEQIPDAEIERIRQEKTQKFEEAVNAKTVIEIDKERLFVTRKSNREELQSDTTHVPTPFQEKLAAIRGRNKQQTAQTLGGRENELRWHLNSTLKNPNTPYELSAGSVIPGVMVSSIRSTLAGQIIGQVSQNVYDTATGKHLLIPQGTKVLGLYSSDVGYGQDTLLVAWQRLTFPDGRKLDIGSMPGTDSAGMTGFRDQVDAHYTRIFGSAFLMSGIVAGISYSQNQNQGNNGFNNQPTAGSVLSQALGQQLGEVTAQMIAKNLNVSPTLKIGTGYEFNIMVTKDLVFKKPYRVFDY
ncbi:MAG: hypothetical protein LEGION0403_FIIPPAGN_02877 [Legionella sp.]|uniref:TrbI/VirB10 family protein n=1 Tax=Legionella sp. TaxID=459 RepID=UPI003D104C2E